MKVLVRCPISPYSGYGNDGIGMIQSLLRAGVDVYVQPTHVDAPLPKEVAMVLTKELQAPFDLVIAHQDPLQLDVPPEVRTATSFVLGWTMWEWTSFGNIKTGDPKLKTFPQRYGAVDAIACYSDVTTAALESVLPDFPPKFECQGGFWPDDWPYVERDWFHDQNSKGEDRFGFCMVGQLHERKDPFVAIQAWGELKAKYPEFAPAEFHLKTNVPGLHPAMEEVYDKLKVHYAVWPSEVMRAFYAKQHCLISTSRGEGKNMPALEMMAMGGAVIATNWGGHKQWLSNEYAYPLRVTEVAERNDPACRSSRADIEHLKELMMHVFLNRGEAKRKGEIASRTIPRMCSWDTVIESLFRRLASNGPVAKRLCDQFFEAKAQSGSNRIGSL